MLDALEMCEEEPISYRKVQLTALEYVDVYETTLLDDASVCSPTTPLRRSSAPFRSWELRPMLQRLEKGLLESFDLETDDQSAAGPDLAPTKELRSRRNPEKLPMTVCPDCNGRACVNHEGKHVVDADNWVERRTSAIHGDGIFAKQNILEGCYFGPFKGVKSTEPPDQDTYCWEIPSKDLTRVFIDGTNESDWMKFVNAARSIDELNIIPFLQEDQLHYRVVRDIPVGTELLMTYGDNRPYMVKRSEVDKFMRTRAVEMKRTRLVRVFLD